MSAVSQPEFETIFAKDVDVPMRDGTILRADVTRPDASGSFPVIIERTPYSKTGGENAVKAPDFFARRGYIVIIQDVRGRFASEGDFYPFRDDGAGPLQDGYDTIEWAAAQSWCNGKVGMIGGSYSGATQYQAARSRPPHLVAQFVRESSADYYHEWVHRGGAHEHGFSLYWVRTVTHQNLAHLVPPEELEEQKARFEKILAEIDDWYLRLPLYPCEFVVGLSEWHNDFLAHTEHDAYWTDLAVAPDHDQIQTPIYHLGGWYDIFLAGTLKNYTGLRRQARTEAAREAQKLIIGPWIHGPTNTDKSIAGEIDFGPEGARNINELRLPWFDHWLKGRPTGILEEPPVTLFVMGRNQWRAESEWPLPDTRYANYYLRAGASGSVESLNDGSLSADAPSGDEPPDSYNYDPENPVPSIGGNTLGIPAGPVDHRSVDARCLTYTSPPLEAELEVTGPVTAVLHASSSALDTDWIVRLEDVFPDGRSINVCDGILRARFRDSFEKPELLEPDKVYRFEIDLWATSNAFMPGHRLRVAVTSSCFPRFDRNLNTGGPIHREAAGQIATNTVLHDEVHASHIVLPLIER